MLYQDLREGRRERLFAESDRLLAHLDLIAVLGDVDPDA